MAFQIQVRGPWAGIFTSTWRPAIDGTLNQTGLSAEEASTVETHEDARAMLENVIYPELPENIEVLDSARRPHFRLLDLETGTAELA